MIHGHHHDNHSEQFPFIDPGDQPINVSAELLGYTPLNVDLLVNYLGLDERFADVADARRAWADRER